ncbi:hypothetical protein NPX13_g9908 [Xylaria arbuscula]|uniref:Uncharacterized protein n=1 Tax=Xylaria arbuscula TaxID=114810 RepID=A0A9W8N5S4_9PEZI|nr:hypothetical protein NPX13_g9908 [Xylaria arbuscula]
MTKVPNTLEGQEASRTGRFSRALRCLAKRYVALRRASPYVVGIVACADSYGLFGGKLCYIIENRPQRWLRILDIHRPADRELVVDIPKLISEALPQAASCRNYKFRVLYQAAGIMSCLFSFAFHETENWLLIINPQSSHIIERFRLASTARIFVRNNDKFLYFGTHSEVGADGLRKWVLKGYDLTSKAWFPLPRVFMASLVGFEIGKTVCFEIFGDYFYGVSNKTLNEVDDPEWQSYYYCFRFPLNEPSLSRLQVIKNEYSWRRDHKEEGPIDDRWGFLSLKEDVKREEIVILECRREWTKGQSGNQRIYYTTPVVFCKQTIQEEHQRLRDNATSSDAPILFRRPETVHLGDDSFSLFLVPSKILFSAYIQHCRTFIDLIDDTTIDSTTSVQRLRLRTGHRTLKPGTILGLVESPSDEPPLQLDMRHCYDNKISIWPPEQDESAPDPSTNSIWQLLNVDNSQRCVDATGDERCVIYATSDGSEGGLKSLVLLNFDPAARFEGMEYGGNIVGQQSPHDSQQSIDSKGKGGINSGNTLPFGPNVQPSAVDTTDGGRADSSTCESWAAYKRPIVQAVVIMPILKTTLGHIPPQVGAPSLLLSLPVGSSADLLPLIRLQRQHPGYNIYFDIDENHYQRTPINAHTQTLMEKLGEPSLATDLCTVRPIMRPWESVIVAIVIVIIVIVTIVIVAGSLFTFVAGNARFTDNIHSGTRAHGSDALPSRDLNETPAF